MFKTVPEHMPLYPEPVSIRVQDVGATVGAAGLGKQSEDVPGVYVSEQFGTCSRTYRMGWRVSCVLGAGLYPVRSTPQPTACQPAVSPPLQAARRGLRSAFTPHAARRAPHTDFYRCYHLGVAAHPPCPALCDGRHYHRDR